MTDELQRRSTDNQPRWLLPMLVALIVLGSISAVTTVLAASNADVATSADIDEVQELVDQLTDLTRESVADRDASRERNEAAHAVMCSSLVAIATELGAVVPACPPPLPIGEG